VWRNAIKRLDEHELLTDYSQHGETVGWDLQSGRHALTGADYSTGRQWRQAAFGHEPVESVVAVAARRHKSVSHGVAILEAAQLLAATGYQVETEPGAILSRSR